MPITEERNLGSATLLMLLLELGAVALATVIAGISDNVGKAVIIVMVGFWMIFAITQSGTISTFTNLFTELVDNPINAG